MKGYKIIRKDMTHHGFKYQRGLNFDPQGDQLIPLKKGIHFFTEIENMLHWLEYGDYLWEVKLANDSQYLRSPKRLDIFCTNKLVLLKKHSLTSEKIWGPLKGKINTKAINGAVVSGNLELVKFLISKKAPMNGYALHNAALCNHVDIVDLLIEHNAPMFKNTLSCLENVTEDILARLRSYSESKDAIETPPT